MNRSIRKNVVKCAFVAERHTHVHGTVTDRSLRGIVGKCAFTGGVEPRPYEKCVNFKVKTVRRQYRAYGRFHHDR